VEVNLNGSFGHVEQLCDRGLGQVLSVAQEEQGPVALVERRQGGTQVDSHRCVDYARVLAPLALGELGRVVRPLALAVA
jgi:hypothetical protein